METDGCFLLGLRHKASPGCVNHGCFSFYPANTFGEEGVDIFYTLCLVIVQDMSYAVCLVMWFYILCEVANDSIVLEYGFETFDLLVYNTVIQNSALGFKEF